MKVRGIRGAISVEENTPDAIFAATRELMDEVVARNQLKVDDVASVLLTMTPDLNAAFPAKAVRSVAGWEWVPLMCSSELHIDGALPRCVRVLLHVNTDLGQDALSHVYLKGATVLRPDLADK
ncbi:chorismate mutase [Alicyclobacillus sp. ALC3]|uniref:chorismate mutase n=1 Tax=Alicyclobacillus sp. ALC3 TaxID=2796143 RepID=UPI0023783EB2|nr:chorismate mutase [Alicyclobacillus sp. ALC3]WDL97203.1 chorismate mutase [Alicyclobacillus sp. ALC3]